MTVDEIKQQYSMREIVERYGIRVKRDGMCSCPFHGADKHASMKVYKDSFHCFACGANGDIFSFIQRIDNCDFKTVFYSLGGNYKDASRKERILANAKLQRAKQEREREEKAKENLVKDMVVTIDLCRDSIEQDHPYSERWCLSQNMLPLIQYLWEAIMINGEEVKVPNVHRICAGFRRKYDSARGFV